MIIDKTKPEFDDVPHSLDGEVLLERTVDAATGQITGWLTAPLATVRARKNDTDVELTASGWMKYKNVINAIP